jgi:hypothetical protein
MLQEPQKIASTYSNVKTDGSTMLTIPQLAIVKRVTLKIDPCATSFD